MLLLLSGLLIRVFRARGHYREMSRQDRLSGLANHAWFFERAEEILESVNSSREKVFLILGDIDHFKAINDRFGHLMGDQVLGQIARRLKESFGDDALIGRIGGEEFGILVCDWELEAVIEGVERFQTETRTKVREGDPVVTLSFGIAEVQYGDSLTDLRKRADAALYRAKDTGRDRYVIDTRGVH